ncbi:hypothetical protein [Rathayibacter sp. RFBD1]|nr:hypothetical protein [Rathayibacter sp. RFBD1]
MADKSSRRRAVVGRITTSEARSADKRRTTPEQLAAAAKRIDQAYRRPTR